MSPTWTILPAAERSRREPRGGEIPSYLPADEWHEGYGDGQHGGHVLDGTFTTRKKPRAVEGAAIERAGVV